MSGFADIDSLTRLEGATDSTPIGNVGDSLKVAQTQTVPALPVMGSGSLTALNTEVVFDNSAGYSTIACGLTGTWVGTITPAVSVDGTNWLNWECTDRTTIYTSHTANGVFCADISNWRYFRLRMTAYTSGTASVSYFVTNNKATNQRVIVNTQTASSGGNSSRSQVVGIDTEHDKAHLGLLFDCSHVGSANANGFVRIALTTGAQTEHSVFQVFSTYQCEFTIYEGSTTTKGATITEHNHNRASANTPLTTAQVVTAVTTSGTAFFGPVRFGSAGGNSSAINLPRGQEWILKTATEYLIEVKSLQNNNDITIVVDHYRNQA